MAAPTDIINLSVAEMALAYSEPAPMINKFTANVRGDAMRLTFMEAFEGGIATRCAVSFIMEDAKQLRDLLAVMVERWENASIRH